MTTPDDLIDDGSSGGGDPVDPHAVSPVVGPRRPRRNRAFLAVAAALLAIVGVVTAIALNEGGDGTDTAGDPTPSVEPTAGPTAAPTGGVTPEPTGEATPEPAATPTPEATPTDAPVALPDGAVAIGTSADGSLDLIAVPTTEELGCEGGPGYDLYWANPAGELSVATSTRFGNVPSVVPGPGGRVAMLDRCEGATSSLYLGHEEPAGTLGELTLVTPEGWEGSYVSSVNWLETGMLYAEVTRFDDLQITEWDVAIDPDTAQVASFSSRGPGECSATALTDVRFAPFDDNEGWTAKARAIQAAALSCDYDAVAALAADPFTYSFGIGDDFAEHLREAEENIGDHPMAMLVRLLEVEPGTQLLDEDNTRVVWPAFFACEVECGMDVDELHRLGYTDEEITGFEEFGGYFGYRMAFESYIGAEGITFWDWTYFVAGD